MKKLTFLTVVAVCFTVVAMIGCSSDSATDSKLIVGDTTSETFQFLRDSIGGVTFDLVGNGLDLSFGLLENQFPSAAVAKLGFNKSTAVPVIIVTNSYTYANGWHIFDYAATFINVEINDTTIVQGIDSIQTLENNVPVPNPDSAVINAIKIRAQYAFENNTFGSGVGHQSFDVGAVPNFDSLSIATVNGNSNDTLNAQFIEALDTCSLDLNNSISINNVVFVIDDAEDCPTSGSIVASQNIMLNCVGGQGSTLDSLNISGGWTATMNFNGATTNITFTDGTTTWSFTENCVDSSSAMSSTFSGLTVKQ